jgi:phosphoribosylformylglycinamidine (FGAM) synthase-like amidotransferase family enzyme
MNNFAKSMLRIQSSSSSSGSCDPEYDDITVILQKHGEVTGIMVHPGTGTHEEENKNWQEIKKKRIEERRRNRLRL